MTSHQQKNSIRSVATSGESNLLILVPRPSNSCGCIQLNRLHNVFCYLNKEVDVLAQCAFIRTSDANMLGNKFRSLAIFWQCEGPSSGIQPVYNVCNIVIVRLYTSDVMSNYPKCNEYALMLPAVARLLLVFNVMVTGQPIRQLDYHL